MRKYFDQFFQSFRFIHSKKPLNLLMIRYTDSERMYLLVINPLFIHLRVRLKAEWYNSIMWITVYLQIRSVDARHLEWGENMENGDFMNLWMSKCFQLLNLSKCLRESSLLPSQYSSTISDLSLIFTMSFMGVSYHTHLVGRFGLFFPRPIFLSL